MSERDAQGAGPQRGRNETEEERDDRRWNDLLQELRVMQTGAQLTAGFLLTLPFQTGFSKLDTVSTGLYLALVFLAALTTAIVIGPVAIHRRLTGRHIKERVVDAAHLLIHGALTCLALLVTGMVMLIFHVVVGRTESLIAGAAIAVVLAVLLVVVPYGLTRGRE